MRGEKNRRSGPLSGCLACILDVIIWVESVIAEGEVPHLYVRLGARHQCVYSKHYPARTKYSFFLGDTFLQWGIAKS